MRLSHEEECRRVSPDLAKQTVSLVEESERVTKQSKSTKQRRSGMETMDRNNRRVATDADEKSRGHWSGMAQACMKRSLSGSALGDESMSSPASSGRQSCPAHMHSPPIAAQVCRQQWCSGSLSRPQHYSCHQRVTIVTTSASRQSSLHSQEVFRDSRRSWSSH